MPSAAELRDIYDTGYFRDDPEAPDREGYADYRGDEPAHRRNARRRLRLLTDLGFDNGRLLDVGCAAGFFVSEAERSGWDAEGIDVAEEMITWGQQHVSVNLAVGAFGHHCVSSRTFDVVTMWDYIEHSINPRGDLERAWEILAPGGTVAISTGDIGSPFARLCGRRWHLLTPRHHNYFFSQATLGRLLHETGFETVRSRRYAAWYSAQHLVYKLESLVTRGAGRAASHRLGSALGRVEVPANLFDIVTVIARKRTIGS